MTLKCDVSLMVPTAILPQPQNYLVCSKISRRGSKVMLSESWRNILIIQWAINLFLSFLKTSGNMTTMVHGATLNGIRCPGTVAVPVFNWVLVRKALTDFWVRTLVTQILGIYTWEHVSGDFINVFLKLTFGWLVKSHVIIMNIIKLRKKSFLVMKYIFFIKITQSLYLSPYNSLKTTSNSPNTPF